MCHMLIGVIAILNRKTQHEMQLGVQYTAHGHFSREIIVTSDWTDDQLSHSCPNKHASPGIPILATN